MTKRDQHMIVTEILDGVRETVLERINRVPADWDGIELRQWVSDVVKERYALGKMSPVRLKSYENARIVENL